MTWIIKASFKVKSQVSFNMYFNEKESTKVMNKQVNISFKTNPFKEHRTQLNTLGKR